jgi:hypothetical protein
VGGRQRGAGPLQRAVDRGDAGAEQVGDLLGGPGEHVTQDQHGPLGAGQQLQGGDEGQGDALAPVHDGGGVGVGVGELVEQRIGVRLQPRDVERAADRAAGPAVDHLEAGRGADPIQPVPQRRPALIPVEPPPGTQQRLLDRLLGVVERAEHPVAVQVKSPQMRCDERLERHVVAVAGSRQQRLGPCLHAHPAHPSDPV